MAEGLGFQFSIEFDPFGIPRGFKDRFEAALREEAVSGMGLECYLGGLGGNRFTYGFVWRPGGDITLEDRQAFECWLRARPVFLPRLRQVRRLAQLGQVAADAEHLGAEQRHVVFTGAAFAEGAFGANEFGGDEVEAGPELFDAVVVGVRWCAAHKFGDPVHRRYNLT